MGQGVQLRGGSSTSDSQHCPVEHINLNVAHSWTDQGWRSLVRSGGWRTQITKRWFKKTKHMPICQNLGGCSPSGISLYGTDVYCLFLVINISKADYLAGFNNFLFPMLPNRASLAIKLACPNLPKLQNICVKLKIWTDSMVWFLIRFWCS